MKRIFFFILIIVLAGVAFALADSKRDSLLYQLGRIDQQLDMLNAQKADVIRQIKAIDEPTTSGLTTIKLQPEKKK